MCSHITYYYIIGVLHVCVEIHAVSSDKIGENVKSRENPNFLENGKMVILVKSGIYLDLG